ncbi:prespore-specific regulator [Paenibacillus mucilaginosus]|uniref:RsfA family transcriptional regulator n=1 Tax=Paenibacillus mucilaginosus TaxID=61624 RepID=UPI003D258DB1
MIDRKDCWKPEEDTYLAEVILEHIRGGSTQLTAFEVVAESLGRTAAACGFRWNADVRKRYLEEIKQAKQDRMASKQTARLRPIRLKPAPDELQGLQSLDMVINYVRTMKVRYEALNQQLQRVTEELEEKDRRIHELEAQLLNSKGNVDTSLSEDFKKMLKLLERARMAGLLAESFEQSQIS